LLTTGEAFPEDEAFFQNLLDAMHSIESFYVSKLQETIRRFAEIQDEVGHLV